MSTDDFVPGGVERCCIRLSFGSFPKLIYIYILCL